MNVLLEYRVEKTANIFLLNFLAKSAVINVPLSNAASTTKTAFERPATILFLLG